MEAPAGLLGGLCAGDQVMGDIHDRGQLAWMEGVTAPGGWAAWLVLLGSWPCAVPGA